MDKIEVSTNHPFSSLACVISTVTIYMALSHFTVIGSIEALHVEHFLSDNRYQARNVDILQNTTTWTCIRHKPLCQKFKLAVHGVATPHSPIELS